MVDETTDVSNKEQVVICFQWMDKKLEAHEEFVVCQVESTGASMLQSVRICNEEPRTVYTHCYGQALSVAVADTVNTYNFMRNAQDCAYEFVKLVKRSPRRDAMLKNLK